MLNQKFNDLRQLFCFISLFYLFISCSPTTPLRYEAACDNNLRLITTALLQYESKYGIFPEGDNNHIAKLLIDEGHINTKDVFICPVFRYENKLQNNQIKQCSYNFFNKGQKNKLINNHALVLVADKKGNHKNKTIKVFYSDYARKVMTYEEFDKEMSAQLALLADAADGGSLERRRGTE